MPNWAKQTANSPHGVHRDTNINQITPQINSNKHTRHARRVAIPLKIMGLSTRFLHVCSPSVFPRCQEGVCRMSAVSEPGLTCLSDSFVPCFQIKPWFPLFPILFLNSSVKQYNPRFMLSPSLRCPFETQPRPWFYFNQQYSRRLPRQWQLSLVVGHITPASASPRSPYFCYLVLHPL